MKNQPLFSYDAALRGQYKKRKKLPVAKKRAMKHLKTLLNQNTLWMAVLSVTFFFCYYILHKRADLPQINMYYRLIEPLAPGQKANATVINSTQLSQATEQSSSSSTPQVISTTLSATVETATATATASTAQASNVTNLSTLQLQSSVSVSYEASQSVLLKNDTIELYTSTPTTTTTTTTERTTTSEYCSARVEYCKKVVTPQLMSAISSAPCSAASSECCRPKVQRTSCSSPEVRDSGSRFACINDLEVEEYDYAAQFNCILNISQTAANMAKGSTTVPRIGHGVYYYGGASKLKFYYSLSIISLIRHMKTAYYFFWNDGLPSGRWWIELLCRINHPNSTELLGLKGVPSDFKVKFISVRRERPSKIYGKHVVFAAHASDLVRLEAMIHFGGGYMDFDAFAVNSIDPLMNASFVLGYEKEGYLNNGIMFSAPNADYATIWHCEYSVDYNPDSWMEHSVFRSHKIAEQCPRFIRREFSSLNQPNNFGNIHLLYGDNVYFNLSNNYAVHAWMWQYKTELDEKVILGFTNTVGRIWRNLYYNSPLE